MLNRFNPMPYLKDFATRHPTITNTIAASTTTTVVAIFVGYEEGLFAAWAAGVVAGGLTKPLQALHDFLSKCDWLKQRMPESIVPYSAATAAFFADTTLHYRHIIPFPVDNTPYMLFEHAKILVPAGLAMAAVNFSKNKNTFFAQSNMPLQLTETKEENQFQRKLN